MKVPIFFQKIGTLFMLLGLLTFGTQTYASHLAGADLSYKCLGNNQYEVTLTLYRDCSGISLGTTASVSLSSSDCGFNSNELLNRDTTYEVSQLCNAALDSTSCKGSGAAFPYPGVEVHIYTGIITLPQECADWLVTYSSCCRHPDITNINSPSSQNLVVDAGIDNTNGKCNNSPVFTNQPVPYFCAGQLYEYNHGAFDPDNDDLIYEMSCPLIAGSATANNCVPFIAPFTANIPLRTSAFTGQTSNPSSSATGYEFNSNTGQITMLPQAGIQQQAVAGITVYDVVKDPAGNVIDTLGFVRRDIQIIVLNNQNCTSPVNSSNPVTLGGGTFDTTSRSFIVCANQQLVFTVPLYDADGDTISIDPLNTNLNSVFGPGNFTISPNLAPPFRPDSFELIVVINAISNNLGANNFTIGVTDNACPVPGAQILGYQVIIPGVEVEASDTTVCPGIAQTLQLNANSYSSVGSAVAGSYQWTVKSGITGATFSDDTISNPILNVPVSTFDGDSIVLEVEYITGVLGNGTRCTTTDEVVIYFRNLPLDVNLLVPYTNLCPNNENDTLALSTTVAGPGVDLVNGTYSWDAIPASYNPTLSATNVNNPTAVLSGLYNDSLEYAVSYQYGLCIGYDTVKLVFDAATINAFPAQDTICPGDTITLNGGFTSLAGSASCATATGNCTTPEITYTVGSGTVSNTGVSPFQAGWDDARYQYIYTAADINNGGLATKGNITSLAFNVTALNNTGTFGQPYANFRIKIGCTSTADFTGQTTFVPNLTEVFVHPSGNAGFFATAGWNTFVFDTPYAWDGVSNIIIEVCFDNPDFSWNISDAVETSATPNPMTLGETDDVASGCSLNFPTTFTNRPNIQLNACSVGGNYTWSPAFAGFINGNTGETPLVAPQTTTTFIVEGSDDFCTLRDTFEVAVRSAVGLPTITCDTVNNAASEVGFIWSVIPNASSWEISLDSGLTWIPQALTDTTYRITGLTNGDSAVIYVRPVSSIVTSCPRSAAAVFVCATTPCPPPNATTLRQDVACYGDSTGTLQVAVTGPGALGLNDPFTFTLFDINDNALSTVTSTDTATFTGLPINTYFTRIVDTLGCLAYSDTITLTQPDSLDARLDNTIMTLCYSSADGSATVTATGGNVTTGYTYAWDANAGNQTTATATNLAANTYTVTVTDNNGCTDTVANVRVQQPFNQAPLVTLDLTHTCASSGVASVQSVQNMSYSTPIPNPANSGALSYEWSTGAVDVISINNLTPGAYYVIVTDTNNCVDTTNFVIDPNSALTTTILSANPDCSSSNGSISLTTTGANSYTYTLNPGTVTNTTGIFAGLADGTYSINILGDNGCTVDTTVTLALPNPPVVDSFLLQDAGCSGTTGAATVFASAGTPAYTYAWSNGQTTMTAINLAAGNTYTVTVTDAKNCTVTATTATMTADTLTAVIDQTTNACQADTASISVVTSGVASPTYLWSNGATTPTVNNLADGNYSVTVSYPGCPDVVLSADVYVASASITVDSRKNVCKGETNGVLNTTVTSSHPASISWALVGNTTFTSTTDDLTNLAPGSYVANINVTHPVGGFTCTVSDTILIDEASSSINANFNKVQDTGCDSTGILSVTPNGGWIDGTETIVWNTGETTTTIANLSPSTTYTVTITDREGCVTVDSFTFPAANRPVLDPYIGTKTTTTIQVFDALATPVPMSAGANEAGVSYVWTSFVDTVLPPSTVAPGIPPLTLSNVATTEATVSVGSGGENMIRYGYIVTATSAGGCVSVDTVYLEVRPSSGITFPNAFNVNSNNASNTVFRPLTLTGNTIDALSGIEVEEFNIYNRFGQVVYSNASASAVWDGTLNGIVQSADVYLYTFKYREVGAAESTVIRGQVTLLR